MTSEGGGRLFCVATPLGNPGDLTPRAAQILGDVSVIACEDTRTAGRLLSQLRIRGPRLLSLFEHNEMRRVDQILTLLEEGHDVALISEAGTPTISDPGYRLVSRCAEEGVPIVPLPGPCAAVAALAVSGLPTDKFLFLGFPPRKGGKLKTFLDRATQVELTTIIYLPVRRLPGFLEQLRARAPVARVVVAREMTKRFEEFLRGTPAQLLALLEGRSLKGECTLVVYVPEIPPETSG